MDESKMNPTHTRAKEYNKDSEDPIESCIGPFGRYHLFVYIILAIARLPTEYQLSNVVFLIPPAVYTCTNSTELCPCDHPEYDTGVFDSTIVINWNLICERSWFASLSQSMYQAGILVGSLLFSALSDRFGRKPAVLSALLVCPIATSGSALATDLWHLILLRFLTGAGVGGTMLCIFIFNIELVGKSFRPYMCGLDNATYVFGFLTLPGIAYYLRDWRYLLLATSAPWILLVLPLYWLLPESPRWLIAAGRKKEAISLLEMIALRNDRSNEDIPTVIDKYEEEENIRKKAKEKRNFIELFRSPDVRRTTFIMAFIWMMCSFVFFGVNQYFGRLGGRVHLNVFISACIHIPALFIIVYVSLKIRRRPTLWFSFGSASIALFSLILVPESAEIGRVVIGIIGSTSMYISFCIVYLYSSELFPTVIRNSAFGITSMMARVGAFIAPFVVNIGAEWVFLVMFGSAAVLAAISCYFLSETKGIVLPNHIVENNPNIK